jgi:hypothetical protein
VSKTPPTDDLDLHGFTVAESIELFVQQYNCRVDDNQYDCWKVIHGYGSTGEGGVIRVKLRAFLDEHLDKLRYEAGDDYGDPGWAFVYAKVSSARSTRADGRSDPQLLLGGKIRRDDSAGVCQAGGGSGQAGCSLACEAGETEDCE